MNPDNKNVEQSPPRHRSHTTADEIELFDVIVLIWQGKKTVISIVILFMIVAGAYLVLAKESWTSKAIVTLPSSGMIANYNASLSALYKQSPREKTALPDLQQQFFGRFSASMNALSGALLNQEVPQKLKIDQVNQGSNDQISIAYTAQTARDAQAQLAKYIIQVNDRIVASYADDLRLTLGVKTRELTSSLEAQKQVAINQKEQRLDAIAQALKIAQAAELKSSPLNQAEYLSDDTLYLLGTNALSSMIQNESTKPLVFEKSYYEIQSALLEITHLKIDLAHLQSFRYISEPDLPVRRDSPKKTLVILLAIILGAVVGCILVVGRSMAVSYRLKKNS